MHLRLCFQRYCSGCGDEVAAGQAQCTRGECMTSHFNCILCQIDLTRNVLVFYVKNGSKLGVATLRVLRVNFSRTMMLL